MTRTPGPWRVEDGGFVGGPVGFGRVCQMWNKFEEDFTNWEANARLIAAAPEMLEALKGVLRVADRKTVEFDAVRTAIAKADGRK